MPTPVWRGAAGTDPHAHVFAALGSIGSLRSDIFADFPRRVAASRLQRLCKRIADIRGTMLFMARRLAEVASKVGVSEATVSRVLNGKPGVSAATRESVLTALDVLGYERPTQLRGDRARLVGLVLPELQNPIFPALAEVVGGGLAQRGFTPVLCTRTAGSLSEAEYVRMLLEQQVSGMVFAGGAYAEQDASHEHFVQLHERGVPVVLINAAVEHLGFPAVSTDDAVAIEQAFAHLRSLGHQRIGIVLGPPDHVPSQRKLEAFVASAAASGLGDEDRRSPSG